MTAKSTDPKYLAQDILSRRNHSEWELREKLKKKGIYGSELEEVVSWLKTKKYLNDETTARQYIEGTISIKAVGKRYLSHKLQQKRIDKEIIRQALEELVDKEKEKELIQKAASAWRRQHSKVAHDNMRLSRFLLSRGFSSYLVQDQVRGEDTDLTD